MKTGAIRQSVLSSSNGSSSRSSLGMPLENVTIIVSALSRRWALRPPLAAPCHGPHHLLPAPFDNDRPLHPVPAALNGASHHVWPTFIPKMSHHHMEHVDHAPSREAKDRNVR